MRSRIAQWKEIRKELQLLNTGSPLDEHIFRTWKSLVYKDRSNCNPRYLTEWVPNEANYKSIAENFKVWSLENGATLNHEVILKHPRVHLYRIDTRETDRTCVDGSPLPVYERTGGLDWAMDDSFVVDKNIPVERYVTDYDLEWVITSKIAQMRPMPNMVSYSLERVREYRKREQQELLPPKKVGRGKTEKLTFGGESKSVLHWSKDPRCLVSDKTLQKRIDAKWTVEAALTTPAGGGGRPKKVPSGS
jgi:hypothetical protein